MFIGDYTTAPDRRLKDNRATIASYADGSCITRLCRCGDPKSRYRDILNPRRKPDGSRMTIQP